MTPIALTIAGSDSSGGAGIQADLKTFAALGVYGASVITALTAQNTLGVTGIHQVPAEFVTAQIDAVFSDLAVGAVKIGMVAQPASIDAIVAGLTRWSPKHVVLDPVMVATSGDRLLATEAVEALRTKLIPLASVITPNLPEAELLLGHAIADLAGMRAAATELLSLGVAAVFLKGGHLPGDSDVVDLFADSTGISEIAHPRLRIEAHGTGCTLASAIAANLCRGLPLAEACTAASDYVHAALRKGYRPGRSDLVVLDHFAAAPAR